MKYTSIFTLTLLAAVPALALNDISWVSHSGFDGSFCLITSPCRTFQGAYTMTNPGGLIKAMDPGEYGPIAITQSITLDGNGVGASIVVTSAVGYGVSVNTPGIVEIRNLTIHVPAGCSPLCFGILSSSGILSIENVSIGGAPFNGMSVSGGTATIHGVTVTGARNAGISVDSATATISDSIIRYSDAAIFVDSGNAVSQALIERSKMISNTTGLLVESAGFAATARISDCVITGNTTGVSTSGGGQIITFRNNAWAGNTTDGTTPFSISLK